MIPAVIGEELAAAHPELHRAVIAGPNGDLLNAGETPDRASALEVLRGQEDGWPVFLERWKLEPGELEILQAGGEIELRIYVPQLVVHAMTAVEGQAS